MGKCVGRRVEGATAPDGAPCVRVVGAWVEVDGRILVTKRKQTQVHGGYWEFPGGKVGPGESDRQALARELMEELEVVARVGERLCTVTHAYSSTTIELAVYRCAIGAQRLVCREVEAVKWVDPAALLRLELTPPDRVVAGHILGEHGP